MQPPKWMTLMTEGAEGNAVAVTMRIRRWHPGYWRFYAQCRGWI